MNPESIITRFTTELIPPKNRINPIQPRDITSTLISASVNLAFVHESCKSTGKISKSQVIYRRLNNITLDDIQVCFQKHTSLFLHHLSMLNRNRRLILSFDTTKEAFYGDITKADDKMYLHLGSIIRESDYYYEYLTVAITGNNGVKYILDGRILSVGCYVEEYVSHMIDIIKKSISIELILFDRGFSSWSLINKLQQLNIPYLIFWRKTGNWYKTEFAEIPEGDFKEILREGAYYDEKTKFKVKSKFILIKQFNTAGRKWDWVFATNVQLKSAKAYITRYKKRWGIETIYRVTDDIRAYTTSTRAKIRYFLFMMTCFVYNIWKYFQILLNETGFTLANFKTNIIIYLAKIGRIFPTHYTLFEKVARKVF